MTVSDFFAILSAFSYALGAYHLSECVVFTADLLPRGDTNYDRAIEKLGGPGRIIWWKLKLGKLLTGGGFALLLLSYALKSFA